MAQTAIAPRRIKVVGSIIELVGGVISVGTGDNTTLTLPQFSVVQGVICSGSTSDKVAVATSISGNVITFDSESATQTVAYLAWGLGWN
jgi:hypothetical protein